MGSISERRIAEGGGSGGFDVLLTTDTSIEYQQNLAGRRIGIVVLGNPQRPAVHLHIDSSCGCGERGDARQLCRR